MRASPISQVSIQSKFGFWMLQIWNTSQGLLFAVIYGWIGFFSAHALAGMQKWPSIAIGVVISIAIGYFFLKWAWGESLVRPEGMGIWDMYHTLPRWPWQAEALAGPHDSMS